VTHSAHAIRAVVVVVVLAGVAVLVFPERLTGPTAWVPVGLALVAFAASLWLVAGDRHLRWMVTGLVAAIIWSWAHTASHPTLLSHFTNAALGVCVAAAVSHWVRTEKQLRAGLMVWVALAAVALVTGAWFTSLPAAKLIALPFDAVGTRTVDLPGIGPTRQVNRNALAILAVMTLPMALAVAGLGRRGVRLAGAAVAALAAILATLTQSFSAWAALLVMAGVLVVWLRRPWRWPVLASAGLVMAAVIWAVTSLSPAFNPEALSTDVPLVGAAMAPDGLLIEDRSEGLHGISTPVAFAPGVYTVTAVVKGHTRHRVQLTSGDRTARFDLATATVDHGGAFTAWVEPLPDGWFALRQIVVSSGDAHTVEVQMLPHVESAPVYSGHAGDGVSGLYFLGMSVERAATVPAYARMTAATVRAAALTSVAARVVVWRRAAALWSAGTWSGIGLDTFRHKYFPEAEGLLLGPGHAHNIFLQMALDTGVVGAIAYMALVLTVLWRAFWFSRTEDLTLRWVICACGLSILAVHVFGMTDAVALGTKAGVFVWGAVGLLLAGVSRA